MESGWALTREAQRRAVAADGNAGLAVTIDIGNRDDVHPTNKQELGRRLARAARHVVYGEKILGLRRAAACRRTRKLAADVMVTFEGFEGTLMRLQLRRIRRPSSCAARRRRPAASCARIADG